MHEGPHYASEAMHYAFEGIHYSASRVNRPPHWKPGGDGRVSVGAVEGGDGFFWCGLSDLGGDGQTLSEHGEVGLDFVAADVKTRPCPGQNALSRGLISRGLFWYIGYIYIYDIYKYIYIYKHGLSKINGNQWKSTNINEHQRKSMTNQRTCMKLYENKWSPTKINENIRTFKKT